MKFATPSYWTLFIDVVWNTRHPCNLQWRVDNQQRFTYFRLIAFLQSTYMNAILPPSKERQVVKHLPLKTQISTSDEMFAQYPSFTTHCPPREQTRNSFPRGNCLKSNQNIFPFEDFYFVSTERKSFVSAAVTCFQLLSVDVPNDFNGPDVGRGRGTQ